MYLVDTNIFLEVLLNQGRASEVQSFLNSVDLSDIFMTDFSLHSIGIALFNQKKPALYITFLKDMVVNGIGILSLEPKDLNTLDQLVQKFNLDFDDAYQYAVAAKLDLELISFDKDFDRTDLKRKEPADVLKSNA